jgi:hypothetical protein
VGRERDELADELTGWDVTTGYYGQTIGSDVAREIADHLIAAGYRKLVIDDSTVERAARAMNSQFTLQWEKLPEWAREDECRIARTVLAAAVEAGQ